MFALLFAGWAATADEIGSPPLPGDPTFLVPAELVIPLHGCAPWPVTMRGADGRPLPSSGRGHVYITHTYGYTYGGTSVTLPIPGPGVPVLTGTGSTCSNDRAIEADGRALPFRFTEEFRAYWYAEGDLVGRVERFSVSVVIVPDAPSATSPPSASPTPSASASPTASPSTPGSGVRPTITLQPVRVARASVGRVVTLRSRAVGEPTPKVRWQVMRNDGRGFKDLRGATTPRLRIAIKASMDRWRFRAYFSNPSGRAISRVTTLRVAG